MSEKMKNIIQDYFSAKKDSVVDLNEIEAKFKPSWTIRKNQAEQILPKLFEEYKKMLLEKALYIYVVGDLTKGDEFLAIAEKEANTLPARVADYFDAIGTKVYHSLGGNKVPGPTQLALLVSEFYAVKEEYGMKLVSIENLNMSDVYPLDTVNKAIDWTRMILTRTLGYDFLEDDLLNKITKTALEKEFSGGLCPVAISGLTDEEVEKIKPKYKNTYKVIVFPNQEITKETVFGTFKEIKATIKAQKETK